MGKFLEYLLESKLRKESAIGASTNDTVAKWPTYTREDITRFKAKAPYLYEFLKFVFDDIGAISVKGENGSVKIVPKQFKVSSNISTKNIVVDDDGNTVKVYEIWLGYSGADSNVTMDRAVRSATMNYLIDELKSGPISIDAASVFYYGDISKIDREKFYIGTKNSKAITFKDDVVNKYSKLSDTSVSYGLYEKNNSNSKFKLALKAIFRFRVAPAAGSSSASKSAKEKTTIRTAGALLDKSFGSSNDWVVTKANKNAVLESFLKSAKELIGNENSTEYKAYMDLFSIGNNKNSNSFKFNEETIKTILKTNFGVVASEFLVPLLLINNINSFANVSNLIESITGSKNYSIQQVKWPKSSTNAFSDYDLIFAEGLNRVTKDLKTFSISAKYGDGHTPTIIRLMLDNLDILKSVKGDVFLDNIYSILSNEKSFILKTGNILFGTWLLGYVALKNGDVTDDEVNDLKKLFNACIDKDTFDYKKISIYSKLRNMLKNHPLIRNGLLLFPYSLTAIFERIFVDVANKNDKFLNVLKKLVIGEDYTQIRLNNSRQFGFELDIKKPDVSKTNIKLENLLSDGSKKYKDLNPNSKDDKKQLVQAVLRGNGQAIGYKIQ